MNGLILTAENKNSCVNIFKSEIICLNFDEKNKTYLNGGIS